MRRKINLNGEYFGEWDGTLDDYALMGGFGVSDLSWGDYVDVPQIVSRAQGLKACYQWPGEFGVGGVSHSNLHDALLALHDALPEGAQKFDLNLGLNVVGTWERQSPTMIAVCSTLGLSEQDVDRLFVNASQVVV